MGSRLCFHIRRCLWDKPLPCGIMRQATGSRKAGPSFERTLTQEKMSVRDIRSQLGGRRRLRRRNGAMQG